jgi:hypothetical protein
MGTGVERALRELRDRAEVDELVTKLGRWLDGGDHRPPRELLAGDVTVSTPGGQAAGIEAVSAQAARNHGDHVTQHAITDRLVELDGDRGVVTANLTVRFAPLAEGGESYTLGERYRFEVARGDDGWRLGRIEVVPVWKAVGTLRPLGAASA